MTNDKDINSAKQQECEASGEDSSGTGGNENIFNVYTEEGCGCSDLGFKLVYAAVGTAPRAMAITNDGKSVYVVCQDGLRVVDIETLAMINLNTDSEPMGIVMHPNQSRAYVANFGSRTISQYDTALGIRLPATLEIPVPGNVGKMQPCSLAINPSGDKLFVNSSKWGAHGGMAILDIGGGGPVNIIEEPNPLTFFGIGVNYTRSPYRAAALPDNETFLALEEGPNRLRFYTTSLDSVVDYGIGLGMMPSSIDPLASTEILISSYKMNGPSTEDAGIDIFRRDIAAVPFRRVRHIDTPGLGSELPFYAPRPNHGFGVSLRAVCTDPVKNCLWYGNLGDGLSVGHVGLVDLATGQFRTFAFEDCQGIVITPDGKYAFLSDTRNNRLARVTLN